MQFVYEERGGESLEVDFAEKGLQQLLNNVVNKYDLNCLDYFIIADSENGNFAKTVMKYASIVGVEASVTQDETYSAVGKTLVGFDTDNRMHEAIIIKSSIWDYAVVDYLVAQGLAGEEYLNLIDEPPYMSMSIILHEIGHAVDNLNQYNMFGIFNTKVVYDLRYELDEYVKNEALSLWGEYYAEAFAYQIIHSKIDLTVRNEDYLVECITDYSLCANGNALLERVYRILYYFVIRIGFVHQTGSFNYSGLEQIKLINEYIPILERTEKAILKLKENYPHWDSYNDLNELSNVFRDFLNFEAERQAKK